MGPALALVALAHAASAQPAPPGGTPVSVGGTPVSVGGTPTRPAPGSPSSPDALAHFNNGSRLLDAGDYAGALEEYRAALLGHRTAATMHAVALCLAQLGKYDEALDQYDELRREFPKLSKSLEAKVAPAIETLQGKVGTVVVTGDAPAGVSLFVDERERGKLPLAAPLRLAVGPHSFGVKKEGFDPITTTVDVKPRRENEARLQARPKQAKLRVSEKHGWVLNAEIDGEVKGPTPWEGMVEPGDHRVHLSGFMRPDALAECAAPDVGSGETAAVAREGVKMGSATKTETVRLYEVKEVALGAEALDSSLNIVSTPSGASVSIDSRSMGRTPWEGRVALGEHTVEVGAEGFLPAKTQVSVERWTQVALPVVLEPDPAVQRRRARRVGAGVAYGVGALGLVVFAVTGALAVDKVSRLKSSCQGTRCPLDEQGTVTAAQTLANVSTASLTVGGIGVVSGTVFLLVLRPPATSGGPRAAVGQIGLGGRF